MKTLKLEDSPKDREIQLLETLCAENGYFAEKFTRDLLIMTSNIRKDFPIEFDTQFNQASDQLSGYEKKVDELTDEINSLKKTIEKQSRKILEQEDKLHEILVQTIKESEWDQVPVPSNYFTWEEITKVRLMAGFGLSNEDKLELLKRAGL